MPVPIRRGLGIGKGSIHQQTLCSTAPPSKPDVRRPGPGISKGGCHHPPTSTAMKRSCREDEEAPDPKKAKTDQLARDEQLALDEAH